MFITISMCNQSLAQTKLCSTFEEAIKVGVEIVENWQIADLADNVSEIKAYLDNDQEYHFTDHVSANEYSVFIGKTE